MASEKTPEIESQRGQEMTDLPRLRFALYSFCVGMIVVHGSLFWIAGQQLVSGSSDFRIFYAAGLMLRRGEGQVLYSERLQSKTQQEFAPVAVNHLGVLPYNHPPFEAALYGPMTYLPYFSAYCLWIAINILLLAGSIYHLRSWLPTQAGQFRWLLILTPLAFFPIACALLQGQDSILLFALYCMAFSAFRRSQDLQAGGYLGLGLFKFHLVLPFAFVLVLHRRWRALLGMSVVAAIEAAISWSMVGGKELLHYPHFVWHINRQQTPGVIVPANMANLRGLFMGWSSNLPVRWLEVLLLAASIGLVVWASRQWRPTDLLDTRSWNYGFSICLVITYLVGYHSYYHDMSFLLLPILFALDRTLAEWQETSVTFKLVLGLMFLSPLYLRFAIRSSHQNLFAIVLLAFVAYLAASVAKGEPQALASKSRALLDVPLR